jgi:epoxyqueuosine reductase
LAGFEVSPDFERFDQMNDMFTRAFWDETVRSADTDAFFAGYRMDAEPRRGEGFSQKDFALRNAVWLISDIISNRGAAEGKREGFQAVIDNDTPVVPIEADLGTPAQEAREIKNYSQAVWCRSSGHYRD